MKKLTAGIFASLLAVVATGAAHAEIASKGYVDDINTALTSAIGNKADTTTVNALDGRVEVAEGEIDTIQGTMGTYGDVVTHNASEFATAAQGTKADTAVQPAAISDMQVKANLTTNAEWATEKTSDDKYPSNAAVDAAISKATEDIASSETVEQIQTDLDAAEADIVELRTDKQDKNMGAGAANHIVTTDGTGNITSSATIANTQVSGLGTLATKSTVTSDDITDGTIAEGDLNASIKASLGKADTALQKTAADAAYAVKGTEDIADGAAANAQQALTDIGTKSELTTTNKDNLVDAINEVATEAAAAQSTATAAQTAAGTAQAAAEAAQGDVDTLETTVTAQGARLTTAEGEIDSIQSEMDNMATSETVSGLQSSVTNLQSTKQDKTDNTLTTTSKTVVGAINEVRGTANTANTAAGAAQDAADAAQEAADAAQATANAAIPAPTDACADSENKCVLVSSGAGNYSWEVIARGGAE